MSPTPTAVPEAPDQLAEAIATANTKAWFGEDGKPTEQFKLFIQSYAERAQLGQESIQRQIEESTQRAVRAFLVDNAKTGAAPAGRPDLTPGRPVGRNKGQVVNRKAPGHAVDDAKLFASNLDFIRDTWHLNTDESALRNQASLRNIRNSLGSNVPSDGGFLIPETLRADLIRIALESAIVRPRARVIPMETLRVPYPALDSTSNASSVHGGIIGYWTPESAALQDSSPKFGRIILEARKLTAMAVVPNELLSDSIISMEPFLGETFPEAMAWFEDVAFAFDGTGVGEPRAALSAGNPANVLVAKEAGQAASTIVWENILKMYARMLPTSMGRSVWTANINCFPELATMALSVGTGGSAIWLNNGVEGPPMRILGRPVVFTEKAPTIGSARDISLADWSYYFIGDRQSMTAASSTDARFTTDETVWRFIQRVDGQPGILSAITPRKGSDTLSPFVSLDVRA